MTSTMARLKRNQTTPLEDLVSIAAKVPWWISVLIAVLAYLVLHAVASITIVPSADISGLSGVIAKQAIKVIATFAQYLVPLAFLMGAGLSALRTWRSDSPRSARFDIKEPTLSLSYPTLNQDHDAAATRIGEDHMYGLTRSSAAATLGSATPDTTKWTLDLLCALEWKRFEDVCCSLFQHLGFTTRTTRQGADGGVDVHIYKTSTDRADAIVQCKAWNTYKVGIKPVRELLGVMASTGVPEGIFMTTGIFTREALEFGRANRIDCMDGELVLKAITTLQAAQQDAMLRMATEGDYLTPTCASCGIKLVRREPKGGGEAFWGCRNFPRCRLTMAMR